MSGNWFTEPQTPGFSLNYKIERVLHEEQTPYQQLRIVEFTEFGRALILDDAIQVTLRDEFIYHEMIAHVPLFTHPNPRRVLIIGGGDGGTAREVLRHPSVEQVDMVEIDGAVVEACRRYLPETAACLNDPRLNLLIADGIKFVRDCEPGTYDAILVDSSDPVGPAVGLFNREFYEGVHRALTDDGLFVCQSESPFYNQDLMKAIHEIAAELYPFASPYLFSIATYPSGLWSFTMGSKQHDPTQVNPQLTFDTRYYTPEIHRAAFHLPPFLKAALA